MNRSRFTEEQIIGVLRESEAGATVAELRRKHGMSSATFYAWKAKYRGMDVSAAERLKTLKAESAKLKRLYADAMLDNAGAEAAQAAAACQGPARGGCEGRGCQAGQAGLIFAVETGSR